MKTLMLIDAQNSFHPPYGSLAVPNADSDADRIATFIRTHTSDIDRIVATMDTHQKFHISHPSFWVDVETERKHPGPFTLIPCEDVGVKWRPRRDLGVGVCDQIDEGVFSCDGLRDEDGKLNLLTYCKEYTRLLERNGRFQLCVWPEHCLIGTEGHNVVPLIRDAMAEWEEATGNSVMWVHKGSHILTESYSVFQAEVPVDKATSFDWNLFQYLRESDVLWVAGQAMSHCVNYSVRDIVEKWPENERSKIRLIADCASPVPSFEHAASEFVQTMKEKGVTLCTSSNAVSCT